MAVLMTLSVTARPANGQPNLFNQVDQVAMNAWVCF